MTGHMEREIAEIPEACARLLTGAPNDAVAAAAQALRRADPSFLLTVGRGSSDHAATCLAYACGMMSGVIPASYPPFLASVAGQTPRAAGQAALAISQSGGSPDIRAAATALRDGGATLIVLTNTSGSPLAALSEHAVDIAAGPERSVAATKSFVSSVVAGLRMLALWHGASDLLTAMEALPAALAASVGRWDDALAEMLASTSGLIVLGRGPSLGVAHEIALKGMELCETPMQAFSSAEVRHGPMQVLRGDFPVLDLRRDEPLPGARTFHPPARPDLHPLLDPLLDLVPIYAMLECAARRRGLDPDAPDRLRKVTETI